MLDVDGVFQQRCSAPLGGDGVPLRTETYRINSLFASAYLPGYIVAIITGRRQ